MDGIIIAYGLDWVNNVKIVKKKQEHICFVGLWLYPILKFMWICGGSNGIEGLMRYGIWIVGTFE